MNGRSSHLRIIDGGIALRSVEPQRYAGHAKTPVAARPAAEAGPQDFSAVHAGAKVGAAPGPRLIELRPRLLAGILTIVSGALLFSFVGGVLVGLGLGLHIGQRSDRAVPPARPAAIIALPPTAPAPQQSVAAPDGNTTAVDPLPTAPVTDPAPGPEPTAFEIGSAHPVPTHEPDGAMPAAPLAEAEHPAPAAASPSDAPAVPARTVSTSGTDAERPTYVAEQGYWVQIGAFRTEAKAREIATSLPDARVVRLETVQQDGLPRIWHVVQVGPLASLAEANRTTMLLRSDGFRDAFVTTGSAR